MIEFHCFLQDRKGQAFALAYFLVLVALLFWVTHSRWGQDLSRHLSRGTVFEGPVLRKCFMVYGNPIEQALVNGQIRADDTMESFHAVYGTQSEIVIGRYTVIYPTQSSCCRSGTALYAKDGRLVAAFSSGWSGKLYYFNNLTPAEWSEITELEQQYYDELNAARREAQIAIAGCAGIDHPSNLSYAPEPLNSPEERP